MQETIIDSIHINFNNTAIWTLNVALAFVMFGIALEISFSDFKQLWTRPKPVLVGVFSQFLLLPACTFVLVLLLKPYPSIALGMMMVAACPGGNISNFITHLSNGNSALSVCLTAIATLLAVFMTPLNLQVWGGLYAPTATILTEVAISPLEMVKIVMLLLGMPLLLGMTVHCKWPKSAKKLAKYLKAASIIFFIILVFLSFYKNKELFFEYVMYVFWIVLLHNIVAYICGFSLAKLFGLNKQDTRSVTIETGIQNAGLGLLLIFTFFDGLGGMALLTAFWGLWHMVSGLLLASFWSKKPIAKNYFV